jgi:hypothetical protein
MSIWGVANPMPVPQLIVPATDITLTAGSEILIATTTAMAAPAGGSCYPWAFLAVTFLFGATAPTALQLAMRFNGGADISTFVVAPGSLVALALIDVSNFFVGLNSSSVFAGAGKIIEITGKATTTACTVKQVGTSILAGLGMGPDA